MNRREFLAVTALASCRTSPSSRLRVALIGAGGFGFAHLEYLLSMDRVDLVAVADPESTRVDAAVARLRDAAGYRDYRDLLARDDIDAVVIATPDHWHAPIAIDAATAGKHVYCEKPLTLTIAEGRAIVDAADANGIALQTGSQQRSSEEFHRACEIVRNGQLGALQRIEVTIAPGPVAAVEPALPQPSTLDWDLWLGPAPLVPYHQLRAAGTFRYFRDYSGGTITDLGAHMLDIAQWGAGRDATGPTAITGTGAFAADNAFESPTTFDVRYTYADGLELQLVSSDAAWSTRFVGEAGELYVARGVLEASRPELLDFELGSGDIVLPHSRDHFGNWLDAIAEGTRPICDAEIGHRSATLCHLASIAIELARPLAWDPVAERFIDDDAANALLSRPRR